MHDANHFLRSVLRRICSLRSLAVITLMAAAMSSMVHAQLNGTYTIGGSSPSYATIDAALAALSGAGVSGPVRFLIRSGTYVPPAAGYVLGTYTGMNAINTVTFKPDAGATVLIEGNTNAGTAIFDLNAGKYYIFDGSNVTNGTTKDLTIRQLQNTYNPTIWMRNDADFNVVKYCKLQGSGASVTKTSSANGIGIVFIGVTTAATGNDSNVVQDCQIGDPNGVYRNNVGVGVYGTSAKPNNGNKILRCDIINFGNAGTYGYGVDVYAEQAGTVVEGCDIHMTVAAPSAVNTLYGIYTDYSPGYPINSIFNGNKIYKLTSLAANWTLYGIYHWVSTTSANSTISNNMISFAENGDHTMYGIYYQSSSGTTNFYNNSFYFGGSSTGTRSVYMLYKVSGNTILNRNNIFYNTRTGGTASNYCYYMSSTSGTWTSTNNLVLFTSASNYYTGYWTSNRYTLADFRGASGQEQNCVVGNPRYIDPVNGNLHIQAGISTQVEGKGFVLAAITTDIDGNTRNAVTPDIGADEGAFTPPLANDMSSDRIFSPIIGAIQVANTPFTPGATFINAGSATQNNVSVRMRIIDATTNAVVYSDTKTITSITGGNIELVNFSQNGSGGGTTSLVAGNYNVEISTLLAGDQDVTNDTYTGSISVKGPLSGLYTINKVGVGARNFTSFTAAIADLTALGVVGPVTFEIAGGTYDASTETFPLRLTTTSGMSSVNTVTFRPAAGATPLIQASTPTGSAIFLIEGGKYFVFDGSNTIGGTTKNLTIRQLETTYNPTIWLRNDADFNVIKNCNLQGSGGSVTKTSSANGIGIVFIGVTTATTGNDSNVVQNCTIGDPNGVYRNNVGVGIYGTSSKPNSGNKILRCDIINFGSAGTYGYGVDAYAEQAGTVVEGCDIHLTVAAPTSVTTLYGIYTDYSPGYPINSIFNGNKIYKLTSQATNWTLYGIYHWVSTTTANSTISNNMISLGENGDHTIYGLYYQSSSGTTNFFNNSFSINGVSTGTRNTYVIYKSAGNTVLSNSNVFSSSRTGGSGTNYGLYISSQTGWTSDRNSYTVSSDGNAFTAYWGGTRTTLADYAGASGQEANSVSGVVPFIDAPNGNLHINTIPVFMGESRGAAVGITRDFDGDTRDAVYPDMGADEGDFNGAGIRVITPNGGEKYSVDYNLDVTYTLNRPLPVRIEFSTNGGATWASRGSFNGVAGTNVATIMTPSNITSTARIRIRSEKNLNEGDTSDANFELVLPVFTFVAPNGGERLVPTDTMRVQWDAQYTPPAMRLELQFSTNGGTTWTAVDTNVYAVNVPATNYYNWVIPNKPTNNALMRLKVAGGTINDVSDAPFTITEQPNVSLVSPLGSERLFVGDTQLIRWTSVNTQYVRLEYTTNGGGTWNDMVPFGQTIPAYVESFLWPVPNTPSNDVDVRITNVERPRFNDVTAPAMSIVTSTLQVMSPNGGEKFDMEQPVTVVWSAMNSENLRLDYSTDNGNTWNTISSEIDGTTGSYTFTPIAIPTKSARVRLVNLDRMRVMDESDLPFEIMEAKSITVYTPAEGDKFVKGTTTMITWDAPRVASVNISYSPTGTAPWQTVASNILASQGSYTWNVPMQLTTQGKIRIQEVGGPTIGESGSFSIVDQAQPTLRVIVPNGGENYTIGDQVTVRWSATAVSAVTLSYSENGSSNWQTIKANIPGYQMQLNWNTTGLNPGTTYRVKVEAVGGTVSDVSDGPFSITKPQQPRITVLYPDGGENLTIGSTVQIRWTAQDIPGNVGIEVSRDSGAHWSPIGSASASSGLYDWTVTDSASTKALIRVSTPGLVTSDVSNNVFEISDKVVEQIVVLTPNGGEMWHMRSKNMITWTAPSSVTSVDIEYSTDGGNQWLRIESDVASTGTNPSYEWLIPDLAAESQAALVKVKDHANDAQSDISNGAFSILSSVAGVETPVAGASGLRSLGNYPNPFAGWTELRWYQGATSDVEISIYQQNGTLVSRQVVGRREGGEQRYIVSGAELASGAYIYEIRAGREVARGVMVLVR